jgi:hypothetical protein
MGTTVAGARQKQIRERAGIGYLMNDRHRGRSGRILRAYDAADGTGALYLRAGGCGTRGGWTRTEASTGAALGAKQRRS